jgi:hypothetical protein
MGHEKLDLAVEVFNFNVDACPYAFNGYDRPGEA